MIIIPCAICSRVPEVPKYNSGCVKPCKCFSILTVGAIATHKWNDQQLYIEKVKNGGR